MAKDVSGSIKRVNLAGIPFRVAADANFSEMGNQTENENVATSGKNMTKMMRRSQDVDGVVLIVNAAEREIVRGLADSIESFPISYETVDGSVYRATGHINFDTRETEENRAAIKLLPDEEWIPFVAA